MKRHGLLDCLFEAIAANVLVGVKPHIVMTLLVTVGWLAQYDLTIADRVCMAAGVLYFNALEFLCCLRQRWPP